MRHFPVVMLTGARQVGKSTLAQALIGPGWEARYLTLDDRAVLDAALQDPDGLLQGTPTPVVLDEVQRSPDLVRAVKLAVDRDRRAGAYLLTGSAHVTALAAVSESLAGRVALLELLPFAWAELRRLGPSRSLEDLFEASDAREVLSRWCRRGSPGQRDEIAGRILAGGYPTPALLESAPARQRWFSSYRQTYLERDLRDIAAIEHLPDFNRLLVLTALRTGRLLNASDLAREVGLPVSTLRRYLNLLELTYQVFLVPPFHAHAGKRLVKTPKLYFGDTGMACHLIAADRWEALERQARVGAMVETWVAGELRKLMAASGSLWRLYFWRTHAGREVDFLVERGEECVGIEVKWSVRLGGSDLAGLRDCAEALGNRFRFGILLYPGTETLALDARTLAVPFDVFLAGGC